MSVKAKDVVGLKIITISDGKEIAKVEDVVYDPSAQRITALLLGKSGLFSKQHAISIGDVQSIGEDAVIVASEAAVKSVKDAGDGVQEITKHAFNLVKTNIITRDGVQLGKVVDLLFDPGSGNVEELVVSQGGLKDISSGKKRIKPADIVTIGSDATIVSNYTQDEFDEQGEEGGLKGALTTAQEKLSAAKDAVTDKAQDAVQKTKELPDNPTVQHTLHTARDKAFDLTERAKAAGTAAMEGAQHKIEDVKNDPDNQQRLDQLEEKAHDLKSNVQQAAAPQPRQPRPQQQPMPAVAYGPVQPAQAPAQMAVPVVPLSPQPQQAQPVPRPPVGPEVQPPAGTRPGPHAPPAPTHG